METLVGLIGYFQNSASDSDEIISLLDRTQQGFSQTHRLLASLVDIMSKDLKQQDLAYKEIIANLESELEKLRNDLFE
jgi:hypothetical protein